MQKLGIMRFDNNKWITNILKVVDTMNTLNGGISSPSFKLQKYDDRYEYMVRAPGISPESLRVEVIENKIMIYHLLEIGSEEKELIPNILKVYKVPEEVDLSSISAEYEEKYLIITMPFGETADGFFRSVDINVNQ